MKLTNQEHDELSRLEYVDRRLAKSLLGILKALSESTLTLECVRYDSENACLGREKPTNTPDESNYCLPCRVVLVLEHAEEILKEVAG